MTNEIRVLEEFFGVDTCAKILRLLFDRRKLWENRQQRKLPYRNGNWFTLGASMYLDCISKETFPAYVQKMFYFNRILRQNFWPELALFLELFSQKTGQEAKWLRDVFEYSSYPGFHIFPPEETLQTPFGKDHRDLQWEAFPQMPGFPFKLEECTHISFTLPLALPYQGGGMAVPQDDNDPLGAPAKAFQYQEGNLYVHSGQFRHIVLPYLAPVTPLDWRITLQGHGLIHNGITYLYW